MSVLFDQRSLPSHCPRTASCAVFGRFIGTIPQPDWNRMAMAFSFRPATLSRPGQLGGLSSVRGPPIPLFTLRRAPRSVLRKTRGRVDRYLLRETLAFSTSCRFVLAHRALTCWLLNMTSTQLSRSRGGRPKPGRPSRHTHSFGAASAAFLRHE